MKIGGISLSGLLSQQKNCDLNHNIKKSMESGKKDKC